MLRQLHERTDITGGKTTSSFGRVKPPSGSDDATEPRLSDACVCTVILGGVEPVVDTLPQAWITVFGCGGGVGEERQNVRVYGVLAGVLTSKPYDPNSTAEGISHERLPALIF
jgi:hypothetical protein